MAKPIKIASGPSYRGKTVQIGDKEIPVTVVDRETAEKCDFVACRRVEDMPIPKRPSQIQHCGRCNTRIWVAYSSPKKPPKYCFVCVAILSGADPKEVKWP